MNTLRAHCPGFRTCTSNSLQRNLPFVQPCQVYSAGSHKSPILQPQCNLEYGISAGWCGKTTCMPVRCAHPTTYFSALAKISGWGKKYLWIEIHPRSDIPQPSSTNFSIGSKSPCQSARRQHQSYKHEKTVFTTVPYLKQCWGLPVAWFRTSFPCILLVSGRGRRIFAISCT